MLDREDLFVYNEDEEVVIDDGGGHKVSDGHRGDETQIVFSCVVSDDCEERHEEITVRYETDVVRMHVVDTGHGPIINHLLHVELQNLLPRLLAKHHSINIALSTQSLQQPIDLKFFRKINSASSFSEFQDATAHLQHLHINALYSDVDGNIGSTITGR
jgi:acyl-homoserine lactone acylase PvdQ